MTENTDTAYPGAEHNEWLEKRREFAKQFANETGGVLIELPMASEKTGIHSAVIYPQYYDPSLEPVYRGVRNPDAGTLENQAASLLRDTRVLKENTPRTRTTQTLPIIKELDVAKVIELAKNPKRELYEEIIEKAPEELQYDMRSTLDSIIKLTEKGYSFKDAIGIAHFRGFEGITGHTPYLSLFTKPQSALKYTAGKSSDIISGTPNSGPVVNGGIIMANVAEDEFIHPEDLPPQFKHPGELYAYGILPKERIYGIILLRDVKLPQENPQLLEDIGEAVSLTNNAVKEYLDDKNKEKSES